METPSPNPETTQEQIERDRQHHREILNDLIDLGAEMARMIVRQARAQEEQAAAELPGTAPPREDLNIAFERATRAVRRSIMLYDLLCEPRKPAPSPEQQRIVARKRIIRDVEDAIERSAPKGEAETLRAELLDRLDSPDFDAEIAIRAVPDLVTEVCRDLGVAGLPGLHPWKRRIPHDIAVLNARAAHIPGTPPSAELAALLAAAPLRPARIPDS